MSQQWKNTSFNTFISPDFYKARTDSFQPTQKYHDDQEFDPTLKYYQGNLYDAATIEDVNRLSLNVGNMTMEEDVEQDMTTLQMLQTIFSDLKDSELVEALELYDYNVDSSIEYLLSKNLVIPQPEPQPTEVVRKRQVCRHFLAGECYRKDCWFSHDLQDKICKFWLQGTCFKGDACEFSHHLDVQEVVASKINTQPTVKTTNIHDEYDYPELSANIPKNVAVRRVESKVEEFPSLAAAAKIKTTPNTNKAMVNFAEMAKKKKKGGNASVTKKTGYSAQREYRYSFKELSRPVRIPWLETGSSLNSVYMKEREKAIEYGTLRNKLFNKATESYLRGDGAKAKMYSMEAKHYNRLMQEMHKEASQRIFEQRSQHQAFIDLHGLHQDEAIEVIEERLKSNYSGIMYIVTGTGHHSGSSGLSKKQSKLRPIIEAYLKEHNYYFAETNIVGDNQGGIFAVEI